MLHEYPNYFNLHDLDKKYNDPNRAYSDLKNADGFGIYLKEKRGNKRVMHVKIDVESLFNQFHPSNPDTFIELSPTIQRGALSQSERGEIFKKFGGRCNITHIKLSLTLASHKFLRRSRVAQFDHRRPVVQGGGDDLDNYQLLSEAVNQEKLRICKSCNNVKCEACALAYPEKSTIIQANYEDIKDIFP